MFIEYEQIRARAPWSQFVEALDEMLDRSIIRCTAPVLVAPVDECYSIKVWRRLELSTGGKC